MKKVLFFMENYSAGGLDRVCRDLLVNLDGEILFVVNSSVDERILSTHVLPNNVKVIKYKILTPAGLSVFAAKHRHNWLIFIALKTLDYFLRYPLLIYSYYYFTNLFRNSEYDEFITHNGGYPAALYCNVAAIASYRVKRKKAFYVFHSIPCKYRLPYLGFDYILDRWIDASCHMIAVSKKTSDLLCQYRNFKQKPLVVYNGLDSVGANSEKVFEKLILVNIGQVSMAKNQLMLLKALDILRNHLNLDFYVNFVGEITDLNYKKTLDTFIESRCLTNAVIFSGFSNNVQKCLKESYALIVTSTIESLPIVILEAMRIGLPVVSTDVGGTTEQITNQLDGLIVEIDDVSKLVESVVLIGDKPTYDTLSQNAVKTFESRFTKKEMMEKYNNLLGLYETNPTV